MLNKDNLKISYDIEEIMDKINEIKNPPSFFLTNDRSMGMKGDKSALNNMSLAEKSLISNIRKGMGIYGG